MQETLLTAGVVCVVGAIVGGGLKAFGVDLPILSSVKRQIFLFLVGIGFLVGAAAVHERSGPSEKDELAAPQPPVEVAVQTPALSAEQLARMQDEFSANVEQINKLRDSITESAGIVATQRSNVADQKALMASLQRQLDNGEGTPEARAAAEFMLEKAKEVMVEAEQAIARNEAASNQAAAKIRVLEERNNELRSKVDSL